MINGFFSHFVKKIFLTYNLLRKMAFAFLMLPVLLFVIFFVKIYISVPVAVLLLLAFYWAIKKGKNDIERKKEGVYVDVWLIVFIGFICIVWCYLGGQGGFFYQTNDWFARNAIFRDLIRYGWPVYYDVTDTIMCYYVGHWLPAAAIGKVVLLASHNLEAAWLIGNILLGIWTAAGCYISILLLIIYINHHNKRFVFMAVLLLIFFSGLDIVGWLKNGNTFADIMASQHIEWWQWNPQLQFSSNTTCLYWVFNQSTAAWVGTLCFLNEKKTDNYGIIITCCMVSAVLPSIGMAFIMIPIIIFKLYCSLKNKTTGVFIKELFSVQNILYVVLVVPILYLYYSMNLTLKNNVTQKILQIPYKKIIFLSLVICGLVLLFAFLYIQNKRKGLSKKYGWMIGMAFLALSFIVCGILRTKLDWKLFWFLILEAGIYWVLLFFELYNEPLFYIIGCSLIIIPAIEVGDNSDFCMRASIPALIILMSLCGKTIADNLDRKTNKKNKMINTITSYILIVALAVGMVTPVIEIWRGIHNCVESRTVMLVNDSYYTMNRYTETGEIPSNFVSANYKESFYYKYLMR